MIDSDKPSERRWPPLDAAALRAELLGAGLGWRRIDVVEQTGSTNADLLARAASSDGGAGIAGAVLIAEHQTAGRGRQGRGWSASPRAQITMSVAVSVADPVGVPAAKWGWLPLATGVAVVDTVLAVTGIQAGLKWPNDVLVDGAKLAGILAEVARPIVVIGLGLNVFEVPNRIVGATSLLDLGVAAPDRHQLVCELLRQLGRRIVGWRAARGADWALVADYRARSLTIGNRVHAHLPGGRDIVGTAVGIDDQGRLVLDTGPETGGETVVVSAGDVVHLR